MATQRAPQAAVVQGVEVLCADTGDDASAADYRQGWRTGRVLARGQADADQGAGPMGVEAEVEDYAE